MTLGVIAYARSVARWQPDASGRLQEAALTLYGERGFENTTVADIAERAGLTRRTYFRYFADKREVLFWGAQALLDLFVAEVDGAPASATALEATAVALHAVALMFEPRREHAARRQRIIVANPELLERELIKRAALADAVAGALRRRGVADTAAILTAEAGITVFRVAFERWVEPDNQLEFQELVRISLAELKLATAA